MQEYISFSKLAHRLGINWIPNFLCSFLDRILGFRNLNNLYTNSARFCSEHNAVNFFESVLMQLNVRAEILPDDLLRIPEEGPLIVVANHPFGGIDGLILGSLLSKKRQDFKLLVNRELGVFKAMSPWLFQVDILSGSSAKSGNLKVLAKASKFLKDGNCLGIFPAGQVSALDIKARKVVDSKWSDHPVVLAKRNNARILPICFKGRNSWLFQVLGIINPKLRTILLTRELFKKSRMEFKLRIGESVSSQKLNEFKNNQDASDYLRVCIEALRNENPGDRVLPKLFLGRRSKPFQPLESPVNQFTLEEEVENLPQSSILAKKGEFIIYGFIAKQAPTIMKEIARLREKTFRSAGEGTGNSLDHDKYDEWYYQLFAWDSKYSRIAGGYRLGVADEIIEERGKTGMYVTSEFSIKKGFYSSLGNAIEVGRSFITEEYQRKFSLLGLLWKGIGEFMNRHPNHFILYGPVSISADYTQLSKNLLVRFLRTNRWSSEIASRTRPKHPFKTKHLSPALLNWIKDEGRTIEEISAVISGVEPDGKGIPVLVKHYLKLQGSFVGFALDPDFNNSLDGLIVVDIRNMDNKQLLYYFGKEGRQRIIKSRELALQNLNQSNIMEDRGDQVFFEEKHNP